jgi:eukaryotic-like serine/threonine-protein kinase
MTEAGAAPRYRFDHRIASGGMGEVWQATDTVLGREVAVKVLKTEYADDPTFRSRFATEARNAAALHHPNVASVFDFGELPGTDDRDYRLPRPYLVMELVRGQPLSALLREGEPMPPETATDLVAQAADGLAAAHALGIVHRDVKPANLLVTPDRTVKITDFGIARAADAVALTQSGQVLGTPQYLSPEQAEGKPATPASDIYSLGVVLYECLAGRRPFVGDTPISTALAHLREEPPPLPDDVPARLRETTRVALAKDPAARFATVTDFAAALRGGPVPASTRVLGAAGAGGAAAVGAGAAAAGGAAGAGAESGTRVIASTTESPVEDDRRRRRLPAWLPWAAAAVVVLLLLFAVARLGNGRSGGSEASGQGGASNTPSAGTTRASSQPSEEPTSTPSAEATTSSPPSASPSDNRIRVDASRYVGRPKDEAKDDLKNLGFEVDDTTVDNPGGAPEDTVASVSPTGLLTPGATITLRVFDEPATPEATPEASPSDNGGTGGKGDNNGGDNSGPGNGGDNGNPGGNGKGKGSGQQ